MKLYSYILFFLNISSFCFSSQKEEPSFEQILLTHQKHRKSFNCPEKIFASKKTNQTSTSSTANNSLNDSDISDISDDEKDKKNTANPQQKFDEDNNPDATSFEEK